eukprot:Sro603_g173830.1 SEC14-like protein 2 (475) ;mRNA; r:3807-5231
MIFSVTSNGKDPMASAEQQVPPVISITSAKDAPEEPVISPSISEDKDDKEEEEEEPPMMAPSISKEDNDTCVLATPTANKSNNNKDDEFKEVVDLWGLTLEEEQQLQELHDSVQDVDHPHAKDFHTLVRFLTGPQGPAMAEPNFRDMIQWRRDNHVDDMLQNYQPDPFLVEYASPMAFLKDYDREGDPIYIERGAAMDAQGLLQRYSQEDLMRHAIWLREVQSEGDWVDDYERRQGHAIKDITVVYDLEGLNPKHYTPHVLAWFQSHVQMTDDYYPGPIKRIIVIRAPAVFRVMWNTVKFFMPRGMRDMMVFTNQHNYLQVLDKYLDVDVLPPCINPNGKGETAMGMPKSLVAGKIPEHIGVGGEGHLQSEAATIQPVPALPLKKQPSHGTVETCSDTGSVLDDDEADMLDDDRYTSWEQETPEQHFGENWEEVVFSESHHHQTTQVHVFWQETTGVEVSHKLVDSDRQKLIFI